MIAISQSEIATWQRCRRKWLITYGLGFVPAEESPVSARMLGTRAHTALEGYYGYGLDPVTVLDLLYRFAIDESPGFEKELRAEHDMAQAMITGYLEWLETDGADAGLLVVKTEADIQVPLPDLPGVALRARMDQVFQRQSDNALSFMDYKTSASFEKHEYLDLDPQLKIYSLVQMLAAGHGAPAPGMQLRPDRPFVDGAMITTLRRVKRTERSKPPYYQRDELRYNMDQLAAAYNRVVSVCREIQEARAALYDGISPAVIMSSGNGWQQAAMRPTPVTSDCAWSCPLSSGLCQAMDDGSDWAAILESSGRFRREDPYEYYRTDALRPIRAKLAGLADSVEGG